MKSTILKLMVILSISFCLTTSLFAIEFSERLIADSLGWIHDILACDLDSDGDFDILCCEHTHDGRNYHYRLLMWEQDDDNEFTGHIIAGDFGFLVGLDALDFDDDGDIDIVLAGGVNNRTITVMENIGNLEFEQHSIPTNISDSLWFCPRSIGVADFDGNGRLDIAVSFFWESGCGAVTGGLAWFSQIDDYDIVGSEVARDNKKGWTNQVVIDFNGDGNFDIIAKEATLWGMPEDLRFGRWMNDGEGNFEFVAFPFCFWDYGISKFLDMNRDDCLDLVAYKRNEQRNSSDIIWLEGNNRYEYTEHEILSGYLAVNSIPGIATADFDGDDDIDIIVVGYPQNPRDQCVIIMENDGDNSFEAQEFGDLAWVQRVKSSTGDEAYPGFIVSTMEIGNQPPYASSIYWFENQLNQSIPNNKQHRNPDNFKLISVYPNPFNSTTQLQYNIPKQSYIDLSVYNLSGKTVKTLHSGETEPGSYSINWNAGNLPSGVYIVRLEAGTAIHCIKTVLIR